MAVNQKVENWRENQLLIEDPAQPEGEEEEPDAEAMEGMDEESFAQRV